MNKTKWILDHMHSEIMFKVKHMMLTTVTGHFGIFKAEAITEEDDFNKTTDISFTAEVASLYTNNTQRDNHLKSEDFFNADQFPELRFIAKNFIADDGKLAGDLTIRGISKPVTLEVEFSGIATDPMGQTRAGFSLQGKLSRKDFGLHWNMLTEAGGIVVGDEVKIFAEIQFIKEQPGSEDHGVKELTEEKPGK